MEDGDGEGGVRTTSSSSTHAADQLVSMGFSRAASEAALARARNDIGHGRPAG